jgi:hypothetical protein
MVLRPKPRNCRDNFVGQITKPQLPVLQPKPENQSEWFWVQTTRTVATGFEAKSGETIALGFEAKPRNPCFSSHCARCRPHIVSPDISIVQPPSTWPMLGHLQSSAPSVLLLPRSSSLPTMSHLSPTHHKTSKHDSPHEHIGVKQLKYPGFEFKPWQVNDSSQSNQGTDHLVSQHVSKSDGLHHREQVRLGFPSFASKLMKERWQVVHVASSWRSCGNEVKDGWFNSVRCGTVDVGPNYP